MTATTAKASRASLPGIPVHRLEQAACGRPVTVWYNSVRSGRRYNKRTRKAVGRSLMQLRMICKDNHPDLELAGCGACAKGLSRLRF